jgi:hypothetical protein
MWKDPIVEEIRIVRKQLETDFSPDQTIFLRHIAEQEKRLKTRLVTRGPKKRFSGKAA